MTMRELALLANVSVSTVSKAFGGAKDVNDDTKKRIFDIARQTGCYNKFYKGKYPKKIIAVICHEIISDYYAEVVDRLRIQIEQSGNIVLIATDDFSKDKQEELIDYFCSYLRVDGVVVLDLSVELKKSYDTPIVAVLGKATKNVDSVNTDLNAAMYDAVSLLLNYGHEKIAFIGETLTASKASCFTEAMKKCSHNDFTVITSDKRFEEAGKDGVYRLLKQRNDCTALICAYDNIAIGAIKQLHDMGFNVPNDVSVIGIDNITVGKYTNTPLTTIGVDLSQICDVACELLQKKLKNPYYKSIDRAVIQSRLIVRESIKKIK